MDVRVLAGVLSVALLSCVAAPSAFADEASEISELKGQIRTLQEQMNDMQRSYQQQLQMLEAKLNAMEAARTTAQALPAVPAQPAGPKFALSKEIVEKFELGGELEFEFVDVSKDNNTGEPEPHLQIDKFVLEPEVQITDDIRFEGDIQFDEDSVKMDEYYFEIENLPFDTEVTIGKDDRFMKMKRYTETHSLPEKAFWQDEENAILIENEFGPFYSALSWSQGLELDDKAIGEDSASGDHNDVIQDDTRKSAFNGLKQVSAGLGVKKDLGSFGEIDVMGWGIFGQLSRADRGFLVSNLNSYSSTSDRQRRTGVNLDYRWKKLNLAGQYVDAEDGKLDRYAWHLQPSVLLSLPVDWKYAKDHRLLARYSRYDVENNRKTFSKPLTWGRKAITLGLLTDITETITLKNEYTMNDERTGGGDIDNNEFLSQVEWEF